MRRKLQTEANKYSRGVVIVAAGTTPYPGSAILAVGGARRGNAGYVKFLTSNQRIQDLVVQSFPDVVPIRSLANQRCDALVVGPGGAKVASLPNEIPVVLDSAAINLAKRARTGITVITPHEGELRFIGEVPGADRIESAKSIAHRFGVFVVLKGNRTVIAAPTGEVRVDQIGGPELATAGSGDVLAGLIGSFLVSIKDGSPPLELIYDAVQLHSLAGKSAAKRFTSVTAKEILDSLVNV